MAKSVPMGKRPTASNTATSEGDSWVGATEAPGANAIQREGVRRLTIDIPVSLHRAIKAQCAAHGQTMAEELRGLLFQKYGSV
jgi:hypothetical protein